MNIMRTLYLVLIVACVAAISLKADSLDTLIKNNERVIVQFARPGCPFCQYLNPIFRQASSLYGSQITFKLIEVNSSTPYKVQYHFNTFPTVIYFKNGVEQTRHGSNNKTVTLHSIKNTINNIYGL